MDFFDELERRRLLSRTKREELVELLDKKSLHYIEVIPFDYAEDDDDGDDEEDDDEEDDEEDEEYEED